MKNFIIKQLALFTMAAIATGAMWCMACNISEMLPDHVAAWYVMYFGIPLFAICTFGFLVHNALVEWAHMPDTHKPVRHELYSVGWLNEMQAEEDAMRSGK